MTVSKYTVREIHRMRTAVAALSTYSVTNDGMAMLRTEPEECAIAEDQLRTYMANGTEPEELEAAAEEAKRWFPGAQHQADAWPYLPQE